MHRRSTKLLSGGRLNLAESKGQIVLLDFWASWCGPCMQTMPLVEEAMTEFDPKQVRLVAVNLEEPADQVRSVLERHDMHMDVALDVDGVAAHRYQANAIPQLVIVGRDGKIARLYVGGGRDVVEQLKTDIRELLSAEPSSTP
ncbi:MAG: TlpA disulfide reductase family protein [Planctomycetaceae bacterium]